MRLPELDDILVVVPGLLGSRLRRDGRLIWGGAATLSALANPERLSVKGDDQEEQRHVEPDGLIQRPLQLPGLAKIGPYRALIRNLERHFTLLVITSRWPESHRANA